MTHRGAARSALGLLLSFVVLAATPGVALSWGNDGHEATGLLAYRLLDEETKTKVKAIMGWERMAKTATWMDDNRPALKKRNKLIPTWHYSNREVCEVISPPNAPPPVDRCIQGNCATEKIKEYVEVIRSTSSTRDQKREAIRFVVHMLGDIHQPLHIGDNGDRGGNSIDIELSGGRETNLHSYWDTTLVQRLMAGRTGSKFVTDLQLKFGSDFAGWKAGTVEKWAGESYLESTRYVYLQLEPRVCKVAMVDWVYTPDSAYADGAQKIVEERIARAGARIAFVLTEALKGQ